ncbi:hypothetical protein BCR33DRAFT_532705 [Rhizoclosmatium globosum]|uniref:Uncharacterized protein n=1 Tax=Rhizoclosmatium globosum TaxID=329046 RepID=A0A1Y2BDA9_9FUNG|nr:hypothetical protein BCR33DRAFT_532705 [Rhizoclosmatium globosum]|eukprot:ORY32696.1 hypothetical protein BCR33DRAFT_532705 [Rhizoclosmatium globosum]
MGNSIHFFSFFTHYIHNSNAQYANERFIQYGITALYLLLLRISLGFRCLDNLLHHFTRHAFQLFLFSLFNNLSISIPFLSLLNNPHQPLLIQLPTHKHFPNRLFTPRIHFLEHFTHLRIQHKHRPSFPLPLPLPLVPISPILQNKKPIPPSNNRLLTNPPNSNPKRKTQRNTNNNINNPASNRPKPRNHLQQIGPKHTRKRRRQHVLKETPIRAPVLQPIYLTNPGQLRVLRCDNQWSVDEGDRVRTEAGGYECGGDDDDFRVFAFGGCVDELSDLEAAVRGECIF